MCRQLVDMPFRARHTVIINPMRGFMAIILGGEIDHHIEKLMIVLPVWHIIKSIFDRPKPSVYVADDHHETGDRCLKPHDRLLETGDRCLKTGDRCLKL